MAQIVAAGLVYHGPLVTGRPEVSKPEQRERVYFAHDEIEARIAAAMAGIRLLKEEHVAKFTIATPAGPSYGVAGGAYDLEREGMGSLDAEILEIPAGTEDEFIAARKADALYAKGRSITKRMIDGMERCKIIALGSVGVDSVDVAAATARGIPVTNVPDTFIEEVADHAMMLILATFRRLVVQDRMVRENRCAEGRPPAVPAVPGSWARRSASSPSATWRAPWPCARGPSACGCWPMTRTSRSW